MSLIHVVLCDDHAVLRRGICDTLAEAVDIRVTGEAGNYTELRERCAAPRARCCCWILTCRGANGLEVLASVRESHPHIRVLMVSMYPEDQYALRCIKAGAEGYANKSGDPLALVEAVPWPAGANTSRRRWQMLAQSLAHPIDQAPHASLSEREMQTLQKNRHRQTADRYCTRADAQPQNS